MSKCENCNVIIESGQACPLCRSKKTASATGDTQYPAYNDLYKEIKAFTAKKLFQFLSITAGLICLVVNLLTIQYSHTLWAPIVIAAVTSSWIVSKSLRSKMLNSGGKILICYGAIAVMLFIIDICSGFHRWPATYVLPFLTIAVVLLITVLTAVRKAGHKEYLGYLLATLFISGCPLLLFLFSLSNMIWTSIASLTYALLTAIGFYIFSDQGFKDEMKKRFHL